MKPIPVQPGPGQESVWDYPRPPRVERSHDRVRVQIGEVVLAETRRSFRVLETSHPPTYYLPRAAFADGVLLPAAGSTVCEWKGLAGYADLVGGGSTAQRAAWTYPEPAAGFAELLDHWAVMPGGQLTCWVDDERVTPQLGGFYGGWITSNVAGPFKGGDGSWGW
ncbi:MAG: DUF427 domain-containing protein [Actinomycetota bacterium]|nr:DUF427 domain-containing protein [Actinomycetota bacterium]